MYSISFCPIMSLYEVNKSNKYIEIFTFRIHFELTSFLGFFFVRKGYNEIKIHIPEKELIFYIIYEFFI